MFVRQWSREEGLLGDLLRSSGSHRSHVTLDRVLCSLGGDPEAGEKEGFELQRIKPRLST